MDLNFIGSDLYFNKNSSNCYKSRKLIMSLSSKLGALCWQITTIKHTEKWNAERAKLFLSQIAGIGFDWIVCNHVSLPFSWNFRNWPSFHSRWTHHINCNLIPFFARHITTVPSIVLTCGRHSLQVPPVNIVLTPNASFPQ